MSKQQRIDFDEYAERYEGLLKKQLAFFSKDRGYFSEYKAALSARLVASPPASVLDFGCGIGLSLPYLKQYFPGAQLYATDLSAKSLSYVRENFADVMVLPDEELDGRSFDMIFVASVFHHVPDSQRSAVAKRLAALLSESGTLLVFEHNPYNPVTQRMVSTCPFDADAVLISLGNMRRLLSAEAGFEMADAGYCLFFPQAMQRLRPLEKWLRRLPLGGQYYVVARK